VSKRLFVGNFDFEHRLADPHREPSAALKRLNAELATAWLSIANDGDFLWTPLPIDKSFFDRATAAGLPDVTPMTSFEQVPRDVECVPWGWSNEVRKLVARYRWGANAPSSDSVRLSNSRRMSAELEERWSCGLTGARRIQSMNELDDAIANLSAINARWVVKAEFGMSARERILGQGPIRLVDQNWVHRRLASHGNVFFEPWVERIDELGIQFEVPTSGPPILIGLTPMRVDRRGQYAGSDFAVTPEQADAVRTNWAAAIDVATRAATDLQSGGYFGPLGIDAMRYRDHNCQTKLRPLQDINARWTMGRLSLGWRRGLRTSEVGTWIHGTPDTESGLNGRENNRRISTTPMTVGAVGCHHQSWVLYQSVQALDLASPANPAANDQSERKKVDGIEGYE